MTSVEILNFCKIVRTQNVAKLESERMEARL